MNQKQPNFRNFKREFEAICLEHGGTRDTANDLSGVAYKLPSPLGILRASIHAPYKGRERHITASIFLRFETYSTGKVYDHLLGDDFNGHSAKWNITYGGEDRTSVYNACLTKLVSKLERLAKVQPVTA